MNKDIKFVKSPHFINDVNVVNDIEEAVEWLKMGRKVARFEFGDSMMPILKSGEYCLIEPLNDLNNVNIGDTVLCEVNGYLMTHMVIMKSNTAKDSPYFLIGSTSMYLYGWTNKIYGICKGTNVLEMHEDIEYAQEV